MEVNETVMFNMLKPLLNTDEKSLCPVFAMIKKEVKRMTHATSEFAYITITNKARLVIYRFDTSSSYAESYNLSSIMFGELHKLSNTNVYAAELSFLNDDGQQKDINISIEPKPKGREANFPKQEKYAEKMFGILEKIVP